MFGAENYPITIVELHSAKKELDAVLDEEGKDQLTDWLAMNPSAGDVIPGTNGVRKTRWSCGSKGKRSGLRIIYYFRDLNMPIYVVAVYKKGEKLDLTEREKRMIRHLVDQIVETNAKRLDPIIAKRVG